MSYYEYGMPVQYDYLNAYNAMQNPSTMHSSDTGLTAFFERYLLQRAISAFKWKMPKEWAENYVWYCLYCFGYFAIVNTNKFGVIPQGCTLKGYNVMYQPTNVVIANPLIRKTLEPKIDVDCVLIRLQPNYCGVMDLVSFYADMMSLTAQTAGVNIMDSKLAYVFGASNKAGAESFKKMFDAVASGEPAVFVDKQLMNEEGKPMWFPFANNLRANYIAGDLLQDLQEWENRFDTEIGIPHTNTQKKERLVTDEVNANAVQSYTRAEMWLNTLQEDCEKARNMFGIDLSVEWRVDPSQMGGENTPKDVKTGGAVDV